MKNLLKFKKAYERKSGLNNPLINQIITKVGFDKTLVPTYSKQVKLDSLYWNNELVKKFIDNLYELSINLIKTTDTEENVKDLQSLKRELKNTNTVLAETKNKYFKNELLAMKETDATELELLDTYIKADKEQIKKQKQKQKEMLLNIEYQYKKENGYI